MSLKESKWFELLRLVGTSVLAGDGRCCSVPGSRPVAAPSLIVWIVVLIAASYPHKENPAYKPVNVGTGPSQSDGDLRLL